MKNPFIQMAIMAAAMAAAFREDFMRTNKIPMGALKSGHPGSKRKSPHRSNPAGSKIARRFCKQVGRDWSGELVHTGELTELNKARALRRLGLISLEVSK